MTVERAAPPGNPADLPLTTAELDALDDPGLAQELADAERAVRTAMARRAAAVDRVHHRAAAPGYRVSGAAETIAVITTSSTRAADHLMDTSMAICDRPAVWAALATGQICNSRAKLIAETLADIPAPDRDRLEHRALAYATGHTTYQTRRYLARLLVDHNPDAAAEDAAKQKAKAWDARHIAVFARAHGMADVHIYLPAGSAHVLLETLDQRADSYPDQRTRDQKRVDALADILADNVHLHINVDVVVPADTLAGLQESGASIDGYGPVAGQHARALALHTDARWRRLVTDPRTGILQEMSTTAYRIPDAIKRGVRARDRQCRFPGCTTPAKHTDTDHINPWPAGPTAPANLAPGCRRHHRVKTHSGWRCRHNPDGSLTWTSPLGTEHTTYPWNYNNPQG